MNECYVCKKKLNKGSSIIVRGYGIHTNCFFKEQSELEIINQLKVENEKLRKCVEFYYKCNDCGYMARETLKELEGFSNTIEKEIK